MNKKHYFLIAGHVIFQTADGEPGQILLNAVVHGSSKNFAVAMIGKAQQALQIQFFKKVNDPNVQVVDVPIQNIVHLGFMTDKEFNAVPAGMELREKADANDPFANPKTVN